jgi:NlpC/P60 family putative phage cell wall peptidase
LKPDSAPLAERVVAAARVWIGTPYIHQASVRGAGTDCLGLVRGIWREIYGAEPAPIPAYSPDWAEPSHDEALWTAAIDHMCIRSGEAVPGDVLLFRMRDSSVAKHLGVMSRSGPGATFIHAYEGHGVVESPLSTPWRRRIVAVFSFPDRRS